MQSFFEKDDSFFLKSANKMSSKIKWSKGHPVNFKKNVNILYIPVEVKSNKIKTFLAAIKKNGKIEYQYTTLVYDLTKYQEEAFSGQILLHNKKGKLLKMLDYEDGQMTKYQEATKSTNLQKSAPDFTDCEIDDIIDYYQTYGVNSDVGIVCVSIGNGSTGATNPGNDWGIPDPTINQETVSELPPGEGGGGGVWWTNNCPEGKIKDDEGNCVLAYIKNELTDPCGKKIFTELENGIYKNHPIKPEVDILDEDENLNFSESILKMFSNSNKFLYVVNDTALIGKNGTTEFPVYNSTNDKYTITTSISSDYLSNATRLSIARTMIHESIHAFLIYQQRGNPNKNFYLSLMNFAIENGFDMQDANRIHHEFMGQFVDAMAYSLYQWDLDYGSGGDLGWDYYRSMAFGGLYYEDSNGEVVETDSFKALVPESSERSKIKAILISEQIGSENSKGEDCE